jgi:hypothetical protein
MIQQEPSPVDRKPVISAQPNRELTLASPGQKSKQSLNNSRARTSSSPGISYEVLKQQFKQMQRELLSLQIFPPKKGGKRNCRASSPSFDWSEANIAAIEAYERALKIA